MNLGDEEAEKSGPHSDEQTSTSSLHTDEGFLDSAGGITTRSMIVDPHGIASSTSPSDLLLDNINVAGTSAIAFCARQGVFAVGEKGVNPRIHVYSYTGSADADSPLFRFEHRQTLRDATAMEFSDLRFSRDGKYLVALGSIPDHCLSVWEWEVGKCLAKTSAPEQSRSVSFNPRNANQLCTTGIAGHIQFWILTHEEGSDDAHLDPM